MSIFEGKGTILVDSNLTSGEDLSAKAIGLEYC
jgi:hypothetical protein